MLNQTNHPFIPNDVIIDTGPLLIALTKHFVDSKKFDEQEQINIYENVQSRYKKQESINFFEKCGVYFTKTINFHTSSHLIGELVGLTKSRLGSEVNLNEFWEYSIRYLSSKGLSEDLIKIIEIYNEGKYISLIQSFGLIDTELIKLANQKHLPILTIDNRLSKEGKRTGVHFISLYDDVWN